MTSPAPWAVSDAPMTNPALPGGAASLINASHAGEERA